MKTVTIPIKGMHCASCAVTTEQALQKVSGVQSANVNYAMERAKVDYDESKTSPPQLAAAIRDNGYEPVMPEMAGMDMEEHMHHTGYASRPELIVAFILVIPLVLSMFSLHIPSVINLIAAWLLVAGLGRVFFLGALNELRHRRANMDTLVAVGTSAALLWSTYAFFTGGEVYFEVAGIIIVFLLLGKFLEARQRMRAGEAIQALLGLHAKLAHLIKENGSVEDVDPSALKLGDIIPMTGFILKIPSL